MGKYIECTSCVKNNAEDCIVRRSFPGMKINPTGCTEGTPKRIAEQEEQEGKSNV